MKILMILAVLMSLACTGKATVTSSNGLRIVHYNIKELHTVKLESQLKGSDSSQVKLAQKILRMLKPDVLSINEMQFDMPGVPTQSHASEGQNLKKFSVGIGMSRAEDVFYPANTGQNAKTNSAGEYIFERPSSEDRLRYADAVNFGMYPGQYSTGLLSKLNVKRVREFHDVKWKEFNPDVDLSQFRDGNGNPLPEDMELFDKNLTDVMVEHNGRPLHIVLLHTVPSFHFGNDKSPNYQRNLDQLRFLLWYLGGDGQRSIAGIRPLTADASFVALGDWNVDPESDNPGAAVIQKLDEKFKMWKAGRNDTYFGSSFAPGGWSAQLDYILLSNDLNVLESGVYHPAEEREELGCGKKVYTERPGKVLVRYRNKDGKSCAARVSPDFYELKMASDHLPIFVTIE